jgi:hypothetical protein
MAGAGWVIEGKVLESHRVKVFLPFTTSTHVLGSIKLPALGVPGALSPRTKWSQLTYN